MNLNNPENLDRLIVQVTVSRPFKDAIDSAAFDANVSTAEYVRQLLAEKIGYDLVADKANKIDRRGRPRKYATDDERKAVRAERARNRYQNDRQLLDDMRRQVAANDRQALLESLRRRGVLEE